MTPDDKKNGDWEKEVRELKPHEQDTIIEMDIVQQRIKKGKAND